MSENRKQTRKTLVTCALGCVLETYDFMIYALMAPYTSTIFFPQESAVSGLLLTFATFGIGFLSRPVGAIFFGHIGDRHGRKNPFSTTILLMATSTGLIGLLPGYATIGVAAPILLLSFRLIQGISMGGEIGGAFTYAQEILPEKKALASCTVACGTILGLALGHLIHALLKALLSPQIMQEAGWRLAFLIGGILGVIGYIIRKHFHETADFLIMQRNREVHSYPLTQLLTHHQDAVFIGILSIMAYGFTSIYFLVFLPVWLSSILPGNDELITLLSSTTSIMAALLTLAFGYLADRWHSKLPFLAYFLVLSTSLPATKFILSGITLSSHLAMLASSILVAITCAGSLWIFIQQFTASIRYTGSALSYNIGFALSGGMTPFLSTLIAEKTASDYGTGYILIFASLCGLSALFLNHRRSYRMLQAQDFQNE